MPRRAVEALAIAAAFGACVLVAAQKGKLDDALPVLGATFCWLAAALVLLWLIPGLPRHRTLAHTLAIVAIGVLLFLDLRINNLLNDQGPIFAGNTALRPKNGDLTSPARETVPNVYAYKTPTSINVTTTLRF